MSTGRTGSHYELLGLVSWGKKCGVAGFPSVYTSISAIFDWFTELPRGGGPDTRVDNDRNGGVRRFKFQVF